MAAEWYCRMSGEEEGPLTASQLRSMVAEGRLSPGDALRRGQSGPWVPAASVKGLFGASADLAKTGHAPDSSLESGSARRPRPRLRLRAVPLDEDPRERSEIPSRARLLAEDDAGLDLARIPVTRKLQTYEVAKTSDVSDVSHKPPKRVKGWRSTGLDFLAESPPVLAKHQAAYTGPVGHRAKDPAEPLRRWTIPALAGVLVLLVVVWIVVGQLRNPPAPDGQSDAAASESGPATSGNAGAQKSGGKGPGGPLPASKTGAGEPAGVTWIDASREPWKCGDVTVKVRAATIGRAKLVNAAKQVADTQDDYLLLSLEIANHSATRKIQYRSWNLRNDPPRLTDDLKNPYTLQTPVGGAIFDGQQRATSIYPEKTVEDLLVFERPVDRAQTLRLQLPAGAFEGNGTGYLEISMNMVRSEPTAKPLASAAGGDAKKGDAAKVQAGAPSAKRGPPPPPIIKGPPPVPKIRTN